MSLGQSIEGMPISKLKKILETDTWTLEELEDAITGTGDPAKLKLLISAIERLLERIWRLKKRAKERLEDILAADDESHLKHD